MIFLTVHESSTTNTVVPMNRLLRPHRRENRVCSRNPVRRHVLPTNSAAVPVDNRKHGCGSSGLALERDWRLFTYRLDAGGMLTGTRDRPPFDCGLVVTRPLRL